MRFGAVHERRGLGEVGGGGPAAERQALASLVGNPQNRPGASVHLRIHLVSAAQLSNNEEPPHTT